MMLQEFYTHQYFSMTINNKIGIIAQSKKMLQIGQEKIFNKTHKNKENSTQGCGIG